MEPEFHESQQTGLQPAPAPHVDNTTNGVIATDQNNQTTPNPIPLSQGVAAIGQQEFIANSHVNVAARETDEPRYLSHLHLTHDGHNPPGTRPYRPWTSLQTMHSQCLTTFGGNTAQPFHSFGSSLDVQMDSDTLDAQRPEPNRDDFFQGFVALEPVETTSQRTHSFPGSVDSSAPDNVFFLPEALASIPSQPIPGPNTPFIVAGPSLNFDLNQGTPSQTAAQGAETASVASASSTSSCARGRGRGARGEVRRGQPKPNGWTDDEVGILVRMYAERKVDEQVSDVTKRIANALGKSTGAVEAKHWRLRGGDPKASKNRRGGCGGARGGKGGRNGRGGSGGAGSAGLAV